MDDNKKRKNTVKSVKKFNVLDIIIIVAVLFIATIALILTVPKIHDRAKSSDSVRISYKITFYDVDEAIFDKISNGQLVTDVENGISLGTVSGSPEAEPSYTYVLSTDESGNNTAKKQEDAFGKRNITVTVEADAVYLEGKGYIVDGYRVAVGKEMHIRFPNYTDIGYCTEFTVLGNS